MNIQDRGALNNAIVDLQGAIGELLVLSELETAAAGWSINHGLIHWDGGGGEAARTGVDPVVDAKLIAAGQIAVGAATWAIFNTRGLDAYATASGAMYSETVRNLEGSASGWAGSSGASRTGALWRYSLGAAGSMR